MEKMPKLLIDWESKISVSATLKSTLQALKIFQKKCKKSKKIRSLSMNDKLDLKYCLSENHNSF